MPGTMLGASHTHDLIQSLGQPQLEEHLVSQFTEKKPTKTLGS